MIAVTEQEASPLRPVLRTEPRVLPHTSPRRVWGLPMAGSHEYPEIRMGIIVNVSDYLFLTSLSLVLHFNSFKSANKCKV